MAALPAASAQPPSAFALVESALLPLSGDGRILTKCLEYFGDTPTILMTLMDGEAGDDGENDGEDGGTDTAGTAGPIWSHVVSFMDAFTLASLEMTCRDAYFADKWKTADRWVEWDQMLFEHAKGTHTTEAAKYCQDSYTGVRYCVEMKAAHVWRDRLFSSDVFRKYGKSRCVVLDCAGRHLAFFYMCERDKVSLGRCKDGFRSDAKFFSFLCGCAMRTVLGSVCGWRRIPVLITDMLDYSTQWPEPRPLVSNLR